MNEYYSKLGIGTAQWGMDYGVSNSAGQTTQFQAMRILQTAESANINLIDTASLYGNSEDVLGKFDLKSFSVVTKTPLFDSRQIKEKDVDELISTFESSLNKLNLKSTYGLLVHDVSNIFAPGGELLVEALENLKRQKKVLKIGFSAYEKFQIEKACERFVPDIVQLPVNVFDQRLIINGAIRSLSQAGVEVHARSIFLQGLLLMDLKAIPAYFAPWINNIKFWHETCLSLKVPPQIAALQWVCNIPEISYALVGMQSQSHLQEFISHPPGLLSFDGFKRMASVDEKLLNPSLWNL